MQFRGTGNAEKVEVLIEPLREIIGDNENTGTFISKVLWELEFYMLRKAHHPKKEPFLDNSKAAKNLLKCSRSTEFLKNPCNKDIFISEIEELRDKYGNEYIGMIPSQGLAFIQVLQKMLETYQEACSKSCEDIDLRIHGFNQSKSKEKTINKGGRPRGEGSVKDDFARTIAGLFETVLQERVTSSIPGKKSHGGAKFARVLETCFSYANPTVDKIDYKKLVEKICRERKKTIPTQPAKPKTR